MDCGQLKRGGTRAGSGWHADLKFSSDVLRLLSACPVHHSLSSSSSWLMMPEPKRSTSGSTCCHIGRSSSVDMKPSALYTAKLSMTCKRKTAAAFSWHRALDGYKLSRPVALWTGATSTGEAHHGWKALWIHVKHNLFISIDNKLVHFFLLWLILHGEWIIISNLFLADLDVCCALLLHLSTSARHSIYDTAHVLLLSDS